MKRFRVLLLTSILVIPLMGLTDLFGKIDEKSDFILKLADQFSWPAGSETGAKGTFVITVIDDSALVVQLEKLAATQSKHKFTIKSATIGDDFNGSHIVFIGTAKLKSLAAILKSIKGKPILTVTDNKGFARYGVMVELLEGTGELEYAINKMTARIVKLKISESFVKKAKATFG